MVQFVKNVFITKIMYVCYCFMKILKTYKFKKQVNVNQRALGCLVTAKFFILFHLVHFLTFAMIEESSMLL